MNIKPAYLIVALFVICFGISARLDEWKNPQPTQIKNEGIFSAILGESQRLISALLYIKADIYFHRGYYPSIFDMSNVGGKKHLESSTESTDHKEDDKEHHHHEDGLDYLGKPLDCIDQFSRSFYPSQHLHADEIAGGAREILPWLKMSASFDPTRVENYTVAAFWLRSRLNKVEEAEAFLREGLRANPGSPEILYELGRIYRENKKDNFRARNIWELALRRWNEKFGNSKEPDTFLLQQILAQLAALERDEKNYAKSIEYFEKLKPLSPNPNGIQKQIDELKELLNSQKQG